MWTLPKKGANGNGNTGQCLDWDDVIPQQPSQPVLEVDPTARKRQCGRPKGSRNKPPSETIRGPDVDVTQEGGEDGNGSSGECLDWDDVIPPQPSQPVLDPIARKRKRGRPKDTRNKPLSETGYKAPNTRRSRRKQNHATVILQTKGGYRVMDDSDNGSFEF